MHRLFVVLALGLVLIAIPLAQADQCQIVEPGIATRAVAAIRASHGRVLPHCAPCGDPTPVITAAYLPRDVHSSGSSVIVDGTEVDLAYLYLEVRQNVFENIALRTGCPASDVPEAWIFQASTPRRGGFGPIPPALRAVGWGQRFTRPPLPPPG